LSIGLVFAFPPEIRKVIYTTSAVESLPAAYNGQQAG
jgi:transposase-like protein